MDKHFVSVICEYNPFHFGHKHQLDVLRGRFDGVVCIMSSDLVQRGSVAVAGKYLRASAAVRSGANLVLELPIPWCVSSAQDFARAGVHIASRIGSASLAFGAEDDFDLLTEIHSLVSSSDFAKKLSLLTASHGNMSYPAALAALVGETLGETAEKAVLKPNNILALEYLKALKNTSVSPYVVKRDTRFDSSSAIRASNDAEIMLSMLPTESKSVFEGSKGVDFPRNSEKLDAFFIGSLRRMRASDLSNTDFYSVPDDLLCKVLSESQRVSTVDELVTRCTDKKYTGARVRRAIAAIVFDIRRKQLAQDPPYTCVLAADSVGREILRQIKNADIDIITKPAHAYSCSASTAEAFAFAKGVEDIVSLSSPVPTPADQGKTPIII